MFTKKYLYFYIKNSVKKMKEFDEKKTNINFFLYFINNLTQKSKKKYKIFKFKIFKNNVAITLLLNRYDCHNIIKTIIF